jgi:hypothetical protein
MFIWGTKSKTRVIDTGKFFCPTCRQPTGYSLIRVAKYFHMYFTTIGSGETLGQYVTCDSCGGQFDTVALARDAEWYASAGKTWPCPRCSNMNPGGNDECLKCHRWICAQCKNDNPSSVDECMRCRTIRHRR